MLVDEKGFIKIMSDNRILLTAEYDLFNEKLTGCKTKREWSLFVPLNNGVYVRRWDLDPRCWDNTNQHDDGFGICAMDRRLAKQITIHGYTHLFHFDNKPYMNIKEYLRCTRQPYQMAAFSLMGFGVCDPISYLHLLIVICLEPFKSGTSGKKLLYLYSEKARFLGLPLAWLYKGLMRIVKGKKWLSDVYRVYYKTNFPELVALVELVERR